MIQPTNDVVSFNLNVSNEFRTKLLWKSNFAQTILTLCFAKFILAPLPILGRTHHTHINFLYEHVEKCKSQF